jgi:hypothetical protein
MVASRLTLQGDSRNRGYNKKTEAIKMAKNLLKSTEKGAAPKLDMQSENYARDFKRAARAFTKKATQSPEHALAVLVEMGIYTPTGRLTKNYR